MLSAVAPLAQAHDVVISAEPGVGATVAQFPHQITLTFSGIPRDTFNTVAVSRTGGGEILFRGEPTLRGRDVSVELPTDLNPGPGDYTIGFQITSSDGHATRGMTTFSVAGEPGSAAAQSADSATAPSAEGASESGATAATVAAVAAGVVAVAAAIAGGWVWRQRRQNQQEQH